MTYVWEEKYAPVDFLGGPAHKDRGIVHHVHPFVEGRAHCGPNTRLLMDRLTDKPPADRYCKNCKLRYEAFLEMKEPHS